LPALAFQVADDLSHRRLANVYDCGPTEMVRRDLRAHFGPLFREVLVARCFQQKIGQRFDQPLRTSLR